MTLQRQNEPSVAVVSVNPSHLLVGANDYSPMDLTALPNASQEEVTADGWLGVYKSFDGGLTWRSSLLTGCKYPIPQCAEPSWTTPVLQPLKFDFASDPTVRAGTHGFIYYSGIAADRGKNPPGAVFVARFYDYNNVEKASGDSIFEIGKTLLDTGNSGQFLDKPWIAADARAGAATCTIPAVPGSGLTSAQTVKSGRVYIAYSKFTGSENNPSSQIEVVFSSDCGATWTKPFKVSESSNYNLGTKIAVDPLSGAVYVAWRRLASGPNSDAIMLATSPDGVTFKSATVVAQINPFDQDLAPSQFRYRTFPALAISTVPGSASQVNLAWSQNGLGPNLESRIVMVTSADGGTTWSPATQIAPGSQAGAQIMPEVTFSNGKLMAVFYDFREDGTRGFLRPHTPLNGRYDETRKPLGSGVPQSVFQAPINDAGAQFRHTASLFAVQGVPGSPAPIWSPAVRVSKYAFGKVLDQSTGKLSSDIRQIEFNPFNLNIFQTATVPFIGDYVDVRGRDFRPDPNDSTGNTYIFNTDPSGTPLFFAAWADNRNVRRGPQTAADPSGFTTYVPVNSSFTSQLSTSGLTNPDGSPILRPACVTGSTDAYTRTRNQDIFGAQLTQ